MNGPSQADKAEPADALDAIARPALKLVKGDDNLVRHLIMAGLSAYGDSPINLYVAGPPSSGKTWAATNALRPFPEKDVLFLADASPTSFVHDTEAIMVDERGLPVEDRLEELEEQIRLEKAKPKGRRDEARLQQVFSEMRQLRRNSRNLIDLSRKVIVFLEPPRPELWNRLKAVLSHDKAEVEFRFTDRSSVGGLRTAKVLIRGWPAFIFLGTEDERTLDGFGQLKQRFVSVNTNLSAGKYAEANRITAIMKGRPSWGVHLVGGDEIQAAREKVRDVADFTEGWKVGENRVLNPFADALSQVLKPSRPEDMRLFKTFLTYVNVNALLNFRDRPFLESPDGDFAVISTRQDVEKAAELVFSYVQKRVSTSRFELYEKVIRPCIESKPDHEATAEEIYEYAETMNFPIRVKDARSLGRHALLDLVDSGYLGSKPHPTDRRERLYYLRPKAEDGIGTLWDALSKVLPPDFLETAIMSLFDPSRDAIGTESVSKSVPPDDIPKISLHGKTIHLDLCKTVCLGTHHEEKSVPNPSRDASGTSLDAHETVTEPSNDRSVPNPSPTTSVMEGGQTSNTSGPSQTPPSPQQALPQSGPSRRTEEIGDLSFILPSRPPKSWEELKSLNPLMPDWMLAIEARRIGLEVPPGVGVPGEG